MPQMLEKHTKNACTDAKKIQLKMLPSSVNAA